MDMTIISRNDSQKRISSEKETNERKNMKKPDFLSKTTIDDMGWIYYDYRLILWAPPQCNWMMGYMHQGFEVDAPDSHPVKTAIKYMNDYFDFDEWQIGIESDKSIWIIFPDIFDNKNQIRKAMHYLGYDPIDTKEIEGEWIKMTFKQYAEEYNVNFNATWLKE